MTLINIDSLIIYQDLFRTRDIQLETKIEQYHNFCKRLKQKCGGENQAEKKQELFERSSISFADYLSKRVKLQNPPEFLDELIPKLFI